MSRMYSILDREVDISIMEDLRQRRGLDEDDTSEDQEILEMSGYEFLDEWLRWNGIIGYTDDIINVIKVAFGIELMDYPFDKTIKRTVEEW